MDVVLARLVEWIRRYHHRIDHDIGSSGVQDLTMAEFQRLCVFELAELDIVVFHDSQSLGGRCRDLAERHRVLLVPGECFGDRYQDCARLGFGGSAAEVAAGLAALKEVLATQRQPVPAGTVR